MSVFSVIATFALCGELSAELPLSPRSSEPGPASVTTNASIADEALRASPADPVPAERGNDGYVAASIGPDLIVGHVFECEQLGREGPLGSGTIGMSCYTTACTIGDVGTNWYGLPNVDHPTISVNLFRLRTLDGTDRLEQLGQSWLKHGFGTENANDCGFGCTPGGHFSLNNPGCSDTYAASQFVPCDLGPRSMINPYTGFMPASVNLGPSSDCNPPGRESTSYPSNDHRDHDHNQISHRLQVQDVDLMPSLNPGARYFAEGTYIVPHEFVAGNGTQNNNNSYRRVRVSGGDECSGGFTFTDMGDTFSEQPAKNAWPDASQTLIEPAPLVDGRGFLVYKVTDLGSVWRYEYALYNMNMDRAMGSLSIPLPAGVVVSNMGFHAPLNHAPEPHTVNYTNTPWTVSTSGGAVKWSTDTFNVDPFANAVRWGTMYNFWFDANMPPQSANATVGLFKTGGTIASATLAPSAPGFLDCNGNSIEDRCDLDCLAPGCAAVPGCGTKIDCNANGVPDDCEPDCNGNGIADRCDIASAFSQDCDADAVPDSCEGFVDCDGNAVRDDCELYADPNLDSNGNGVHDACEFLTGFMLYVDDNAQNDPFPGSPFGSDPDENGTPQHPFDAIQEAILAASTGDTVIVRDGTYWGDGNNSLDFNGRQITLRSQNGPDNCTIDLQAFRWFAILFRAETPATRIEGFNIINITSAQPTNGLPAIACFGSSPTITGCRFSGTSSAVGVLCTDNSRAVISHCTFVNLDRAIQCDGSRPAVSNCLISGGNIGMQLFNGNGATDCFGASSPRIFNTTITGAARGVLAGSASVPILENSIVWGNTSSQISVDMFSTALVSYSDVQGGWPGTGNIDANPLFAPQPGGGGDIVAGSPCIDAGNNAVSSLPETDLDGGQRLFDDPGTADTGAGTAPLIDIGPAEWADCNHNLIEDSQEVDQQQGIDCNDNRVPDECEPFADCNNNTTRDICDISGGTSQDCNENSVPDTCDVATISNDCNGNLTPDECEADCNRNHIPDECDITAETSLDCDGNGVLDECDLANCDGFPACSDCNHNGFIDFCDIAGPVSEDLNGNRVPDECDLEPPLADPSGVNKSRSLSISVPSPTTAGPGLSTALRVRMIELQNPIPPNLPQNLPPDFSAFESGASCTDPIGCVRWVGQPGSFLESQDNPLQGSFKAARLQCAPYYHDWSVEGLIQIVGGEIVPSSAYTLESLAASCAGNEDFCVQVSSPLQMTTSRFGDISAAFNPPATTTQPDAIDVTQLVNKFKNVIGAPVKAIAQIQPNVPEPNADVNALDIVAVVDAVKQFAYSFSGPCPCPSMVTCNLAGCASPADCTGGLCVKTCAGGANDGEPCINNTHCPGGICGTGFCRDACGRCTP